MAINIKLAVAAIAVVGTAACGLFYTIRVMPERVATEKREREKEAWANRPVLNATCRMNMNGSGECDFTNTGKTSGAMCGYIRVDDAVQSWTKTSSGYAIEAKTLLRSKTLCSGQVPAYTTKTTPFSVAGYTMVCSVKKCNWNFYQGVSNS